MAVNGVAPPAGPVSLTQAIAGSQKLGQQEFLKLLITQLTNQDPLSPQDDKEFIGQMAQFSTVEGVTHLGSTMDQLQGAAFVGKTVDANVMTNGASELVSGTVKAVNFRSDGVHLTVNDKDITLDKVTQVR